LLLTSGINSAGQIVGAIFDANFESRGFVWPASGNIELVDPVPPPPAPSLLDLNTTDVTADPTRLATQGLPVEGAAADGVTDLVLRIPSSSNDCMDLSVLTEFGDQSVSIPEDGGLRGIGSSRDALSSILRACAQPNGFVFAIYRAPKDFPRQSRDDSNG